MLRPTLGRTLIAAVLVFAAASSARAQVPQQPQLTPEQQALVDEFQQLQQRVSAIEQQAMEQSPALQQELADAQDAVIAAMIEIRPETQTDLERLEALEGEVRAAQQAQDADRMQTLMVEAVGLTERLNETQAQAMARDDVAQRLDAFQDNLMGQMVEIEPETETMIARMQEIAALLN